MTDQNKWNTYLTPSHDEAMEALEDLGKTVQDDNLRDEMDCGSLEHPSLSKPNEKVNEASLTPSNDEAYRALVGLGDLSTTTPDDNASSQPHASFCQQSEESSKTPSRFESLSQTLYSSQKDLETPTIMQEYEFSQRIDRGEAVVTGPFAHLDEVIDPETLTPFETIDDEDESEEEHEDEHQIETRLNYLATQTMPDEDIPNDS